MSNEKKKSSRAKKGFLLTTTIAAAAGLVGAALIYMRKRGIEPGPSAKKLGARAKTAGTILRGESKQAYEDVRHIIIERMVESEEPITKPLVLASTKDILAVLKQRGDITKGEFQELTNTLKADWQSLVRDAKQKGDEA